MKTCCLSGTFKKIVIWYLILAVIAGVTCGGIVGYLYRERLDFAWQYSRLEETKDADALTSAFEEFTNRKLKTKEKPSVLEQLNKLKELVAAILPDKVRHKSQERDL